MRQPTNRFKQALRERQQIGLWSTLGGPVLSELFSGCGFDWILLDTEHSPNETTDVVAQLQAIGDRTSVVVRPAWSDMVLVKRLMDCGAQSLLLPAIDDATAAAAAVSYTRYPPEGVRGVSGASRSGFYGLDTGYLARANSETCVLLQIETAAGLRNLDAIATTPGVDGVFIGPADLAAALGHLGNQSHPEVQAAIDGAFRRLRELGVPAGYLTNNEDEARRRLNDGLAFVAIGTDTAVVIKGAQGLLSRVTGAG
ncbi:HpcH/HpaI aldolase family protein [Roseomonas elaeocarpi]|uniref:HpcH/HpaI aldolase/citrate lyase family protein n=1 Tax=Roseomonas elaeocarpi TaxID=907779 RepID=A0ABV6JYX9_9PROT